MGQRTTAKSNTRGRSGRDSVRANVTFPVRSPIRPMAQLPRTGGDAVAARINDAPPLQAKLKVNPPGDAYERQADTVADSVMRAVKEPPTEQSYSQPEPISRMPGTTGHAPGLKEGGQQPAQPLQRISRSPLRQHPQPDEEFEESGSPLLQRAERGDAREEQTEQPSHSIQHKERDEEGISRQVQKPEEELIMRRSRGKGEAPPITEGFAAQLHSSRGDGKPLPPGHRQFFESQLSSDLSHVRVHEGPRAANLNRSINAQAFTRGNNIYFDSGAYDPNSASGQRLLAHELTHVVQQGHAAPLSSTPSSSPRALQSTSTPAVQRREAPGESDVGGVPLQEKNATPGMNTNLAEAVIPQALTLATKDAVQSREQQERPGPPQPPETGKGENKQADTTSAKEETGPGEGEASVVGPEGGTPESVQDVAVALSPREAIAPVISAVGQRAAGARKHSPAGKAVASAQAAAVNPKTEQTRSAATQTVTDLDAAKAEEVKRGEFKAKLKQAIEAATPQPKTEAEAERVQKTGAAQASQTLRGQLASERAVAAGPLQSAAGAEISPSSQEAPPKTDLQAEPLGPPPSPVPAGPVAPAPLPAQRLDYSSDRAETDQAMAQNNISKEQLAEGNDPAFGPTLAARTEAEKHEAGAEARYRQTEASEQQQARGTAQQTLVQGLTGIHGTRSTQLGLVTKQQQATKEKDAAERQRITDHITGIKNKTREQVETLLKEMETEASNTFEAGLQRAEKAYEAAFEEAKGGVGDWLTNWGDDWERHIENALATARREYLAQVDAAIDEVASLVDAKLKKAKQQVADGRKEVEDYVKGLDQSVKQFGEEALQTVSTEFDAMGAEIDQCRDGLIDKLTQQYKASYERMSTTEEKLRSENKSLWQRVYDATVGVIKQIVAFKDMLLGVLGRAASVIGDIIAHPIRFLGNLIAGVMQGLKNFMSKIGMYLQKGLMDWLFGALAGAGLVLPEKFDLQGIISIILQVLGLTYANFRARAVAIVGEQVVSALEQAADVFKTIITEGVPGLWRFIKDKLADLKAMVFDAIFDFIKDRVIMAGITWIIGLLNPASAFFKACKAIYDIVMFFINRGSQILSLVNAVIDSMAAIAKGSIGVAANFVENALAKAIPVAIGFLASLLGLGDPAEPVRKTVEKARSPVNKAIDWVINLAVKGVKAAGKFIGGMFGGKKDKEEKKATSGSELTVQLAVPMEMHGESHTIFTEVHEGTVSVEMASSQRVQLLGLTAKAIEQTENTKAKRRLNKVYDKLKRAEEKVTYLISDRMKDAETLAEANKMTQDAANTLKGIGNEFGIPSLLVLPHKSEFVEATVTGYRIKSEYQKEIRDQFYPNSYEPSTREWKRQFLQDNTDPNNSKNFIDDQKRSEPKSEATIDHQPRVVEHWESEGKQTTQASRANWYSKQDGGHLRIVAKKYNSSDGAEARKKGLRYTPDNIGKEFLGPGEV